MTPATCCGHSRSRIRIPRSGPRQARARHTRRPWSRTKWDTYRGALEKTTGPAEAPAWAGSRDSAHRPQIGCRKYIGYHSEVGRKKFIKICQETISYDEHPLGAAMAL
jgi:hypothetical protein